MAPSPARRKSIAVSHQTKPSRPSHKRRPHSITPGDSVLKQLSPASRARRSLGPRKSILKPRPDEPDEGTQSQSIDDTRKSLSRRVSFAANAYVRLFHKPEMDSSSTQSPTSSPTAPPQAHVTDENDYPGARRRSSFRRSLAFSENGEASMDMDDDFDEQSSPLPAGFLLNDSDLQDEAFDGDGDFDDDDDDDDDDDMEMTHALTSNLRRRSRSSIGLRRSSIAPAPSSTAPIPPYPSLDESDPPLEDDNDYSRSVDASQLSADMTETSGDDNTAPMEFTVPLSRSLREPQAPSAEWLALRAMTHSGDTPPSPPLPGSDDEDADMALTEAEHRLHAMRLSLGLEGGDETLEPQDDSFTSSEGGSFTADMMGNETVNITNMWRRQSMAVSDANSSMDMTTVQPPSEEAGDNMQPSPPANLPVSLPAPSPVFTAPTPAPSVQQPPSVFSRPGSVFSAPKLTVPISHIQSKPAALRSPTKASLPGPSSPTKARPTAPPSPFKSRPTAPSPSPRKPGSAAFALPVARPQPKKRVAIDDHVNVASPAKRPALQQPVPSSSSSTITRRTSIVGTGPRRPSGTFAQRKSLGPSGLPNLPQHVPPPKGRTSGTNITEHDEERSRVWERENAHPMEELEPSPPSKEPSIALTVDSMVTGPVSPGPQIVVDHEEMEGGEQDWPPPPEKVDATEQWRTSVQPQSYSDEDEEPPISIEQFFNMTGIRFMDELAAPRRSTVHPSQMNRRTSTSQAGEISLADYFIACAVDLPQLELYGHVAKDLSGWIEHAKEVYRQAEEEAAKFTPALFREYSAADEEVKEELLHQLKLIKANNHGAARSQWYEWRLQWVEQLYATADQGFIELTEDAKALEGIISQTQDLIPSLREEHARVMQELAAEQAIATEIESSDQDYLSELKNTIAEQGAALEAYHADVGETNAKLDRLQEKLADIEAQKSEATSAIKESRRIIDIQKNSTRAEVFRLKDELAAFEALHLWHTAKIRPDLFEFIYATRFQITVPCVKFKPVMKAIRITRTKEMSLKFKDQFPKFTDVSIKLGQQRMNTSPVDWSVRKVVQSLGGFWSGFHQLRTQFTFLVIKYPLSVEELPPARDGQISGVVAKATVLLPSVKAKIYISFILDTDTLSRWPMSIGRVRCEVKKAYGADVDVGKIRNSLESFLSDTTPDDNHACFLDACIEATYGVSVEVGCDDVSQHSYIVHVPHNARSYTSKVEGPCAHLEHAHLSPCSLECEEVRQP